MNKTTEQVDVVIVGAGMAGLYATYLVKNLGLSLKTFEAGSEVGGTWYWNRYPGARCDIESLDYCYSFCKEVQEEWNWSHRYADQPEILKYLNHVCERLELRKYIQFNTRVTSAIFDEASGRWDVGTDRGDRLSAQFCIMATGCLSTFNVPGLKGLETFKGDVYYTAHWPKEAVDLTGKRVGVVGTGSSGIQLIPRVAEQAKHLYVFQRTPHWTIPARNSNLDEKTIKEVKENYPKIFEIRKVSFGGSGFLGIDASPLGNYSPEEQQKLLQKLWDGPAGFYFLATYSDVFVNDNINAIVSDFVRAKIRETVKDPHVAQLLTPDYPFGAKRPVLDSNYWDTFNRENVTLVDIKGSPIEEINPQGVKIASGKFFEIDSLILATGFDAFTGSLSKIDIRGKNGLSLKEKWSQGPRSYLGLMNAGFPNLFMVTGPGSPSVLTNMVSAIEQHVEWIIECIKYLKTNSYVQVDADIDAENSWQDHVNQIGSGTLYTKVGNSWYVGANIPGKPRVILPYCGGLSGYRSKCNEVVKNGYEGFKFIK